MKLLCRLSFILGFIFMGIKFCFPLTISDISYNQYFPSYLPFQFIADKMDMYIISSNTSFDIYTNEVITIGRGKTNYSIQVISNTIITLTTNLNSDSVQKPPLSVGRLAGETAVSLTGAILPWGIFFYFYTGKTDPVDRANISIYTAPAVALSLALSSIGTYIIGTSGDETGKYFNGALTGSLSGLLGGVLAGSVGSLVVLNSDSIPKDARTTYAAMLFAASASACKIIGSILGFNITRSYKKTALPALSIQPDYFNGKLSLKYSLEFIDMSF